MYNVSYLLDKEETFSEKYRNGRELDIFTKHLSNLRLKNNLKCQKGFHTR